MKITGSILKEARERKNITLNEVAYATKINLKALQAIEGGIISALPPKAFVRGFVQVYAEYLKLDVASVMIQFQEEMGSTKPVFADVVDAKDIKPVSNVQSAGQVVLDSRGVEDEMKEGSSSLVKMSIFIAAILVVAVAIVAQKTFKKYENEKINTGAAPVVVATPVAGTAVGETNNKSETPTSALIDGNAVPATGVTAMISAATSMTTTTSRTTTSTTTTARAHTVTPSPAPTPTPAPAPAASSAPKSESTTVPNAAAVSETATMTATSEVSTTSTTLVAVPQEVILEALDQVDVTFRIDNGSSQTLNLKPNQIHTFKAKSKIQLQVNDGGAVNIIHNGQDRGVPGTLGQSLKLRYP